jgi:hypothetical protein
MASAFTPIAEAGITSLGGTTAAIYPGADSALIVCFAQRRLAR